MISYFCLFTTETGTCRFACVCTLLDTYMHAQLLFWSAAHIHLSISSTPLSVTERQPSKRDLALRSQLALPSLLRVMQGVSPLVSNLNNPSLLSFQNPHILEITVIHALPFCLRMSSLAVNLFCRIFSNVLL